MSKRTKNILSFALVAFVSCFMIAGVVGAETANPFDGVVPNAETIANDAQLGGNAQSALTKTIQFILAILGVVALVIILLGGFKWMTSAGDQAKIDSAKKLMGAGITGLIIVLAAYAISSFLKTSLTTVFNGETPTE